jgi:hypothetical protein
MKSIRHLTTLTLLLFFASTGSSDEKTKAPKLPGSNGPLYEKVGELKDGVEVLGADVSDKFEPLPKGKHINPERPPRTRILPAGTGMVMIWVLFNKTPDTARIDIEVQNEAGKVEFEKFSQYSLDNTTGRATMGFASNLKKGVLPNGPYQAKLKIGDHVFLLVNWHIGRPTDIPIDMYVEQRLDQFSTRHDELEERLNQLDRRVGQQPQPLTQTIIRNEQAGPSGVVLFLYGVFCAFWAQNSNRSPWLWFFLGLFFSVITVLVLLAKNAGDRKRLLHN